jgi:hypothetical protein
MYQVWHGEESIKTYLSFFSSKPIVDLLAFFVSSLAPWRFSILLRTSVLEGTEIRN